MEYLDKIKSFIGSRLMISEIYVPCPTLSFRRVLSCSRVNSCNEAPLSIPSAR